MTPSKRESKTRRLARFFGFALALGLFSIGCAKQERVVEEVPRHPFPSWVSELRPGHNTEADVRARFGLPLEIEDSVRGGTVWRYAFPEIVWDAEDPDRPDVSAEPEEVSSGRLAYERFVDGASRALAWTADLIFYPPSQPRPPQMKTVPATIHALELDFDTTGTLERLRYTPAPGATRVPRGG